MGKKKRTEKKARIYVEIETVAIDPTHPKKRPSANLRICVNDFRDGVDEFLGPMTVDEAEGLVDLLNEKINDIKSMADLRSKLSNIENYLDSMSDYVNEARSHLNSGSIDDAQGAVSDMDSDLRDLESEIAGF